MNKQKYKDNSVKWQKANPEKASAMHKKAFKKYYAKYKDRFNASMLRSYYKHKDKAYSRDIARHLINRLKEPVIIDKFCRDCETTQDIRLKFEEYPQDLEGVKKALETGKIFYICGKCRTIERRKNK